jgi:hypothetical protein
MCIFTRMRQLLFFDLTSSKAVIDDCSFKPRTENTQQNEILTLKLDTIVKRYCLWVVDLSSIDLLSVLYFCQTNLWETIFTISNWFSRKIFLFHQILHCFYFRSKKKNIMSLKQASIILAKIWDMCD